VGVVLTDGQGWQVSVKSEEARAMSIKMIAIAIGDGVNMDGLQELTGDDGQVLSIRNYTALTSVMSTLVTFFCKFKTKC
jgi:hypothetical protein